MSDEEIQLPWREDGLQGFSTSQGPTFNGGWFTGGEPHSPQTLTIRALTPMGRPASVELDLCDDKHGRSVTLDPAVARQAAAALIAAAERAEGGDGALARCGGATTSRTRRTCPP